MCTPRDTRQAEAQSARSPPRIQETPRTAASAKSCSAAPVPENPRGQSPRSHEPGSRDLGDCPRGFSGTGAALQLFADAAVRGVSWIRGGDRADCASAWRVSRGVHIGLDWRADCDYDDLLPLSDWL